jgi:hypothetical protein
MRTPSLESSVPDAERPQRRPIWSLAGRKPMSARLQAGWTFLVLLGQTLSLPLLAAGFSEPPLVLYGRILQFGPGTVSQVVEGRLEARFVNRANPAIVVRLETRLARAGVDGTLSYSLPIPQKYLPNTLELDTVVATGPAPETYQFESFTVDGVPAQPMDDTVEFFTTGFHQRAEQIRLDLRIALPETDQDGDGMPDGWENLHQLNSSWPGDAARDADNDGFTNLDEFRRGTDPNVSNTTPRLVTASLAVTERGRAGIYLELVDSDSSAPPKSSFS